MPTLNITPRLTAALKALADLDRTLNPVDLSRAREAALIEGLQALADAYGKTLMPPSIDGRGDMSFTLSPPNGGPTYGVDLAAWLNEIPVAYGMTNHMQGHVLPQNNWCRINHFNVERLLEKVQEAVLALNNDTAISPTQR
jgi:hypothetical protein